MLHLCGCGRGLSLCLQRLRRTLDCYHASQEPATGANLFIPHDMLACKTVYDCFGIRICAMSMSMSISTSSSIRSTSISTSISSISISISIGISIRISLSISIFIQIGSRSSLKADGSGRSGLETGVCKEALR